jgi:hypothetical protein
MNLNDGDKKMERDMVGQFRSSVRMRSPNGAFPGPHCMKAYPGLPASTPTQRRT